uniref:Uncharacterized protein n=1 Tax=Tanacetum cinerariifolium TaxID=118510 RepID=A0A699JCA7_TANCI|nr:hypothetical protein [Tanacetum cinerariifolium]
MYKSATISPMTETTNKVTTNLGACVGFKIVTIADIAIVTPTWIVTIADIAIVTPTWYVGSSKKHLSTSSHICWLYRRFRPESHLLCANHRSHGSKVRKGDLMGDDLCKAPVPVTQAINGIRATGGMSEFVIAAVIGITNPNLGRINLSREAQGSIICPGKPIVNGHYNSFFPLLQTGQEALSL